MIILRKTIDYSKICYVILFTLGILFDSMLSASWLAEFCGPCMRVMHFEYPVSDLNYNNIISLIKEEISSPLKICWPSKQ